MKNIYICFFLILVILPLKLLAINNNDSPKINTKIETPNFVIVYNKNLEETAYTLANNIEKWGAEVYNFHGEKPRVKIYVFLSNNVDFVNSYSTNNRINLWLNTSQELGELHKVSNSWLESVFKHELTHNINQLYNHGLLYIYFFPYLERLFAPSWLEEGTAVYNETKLSPNGRAYDEVFYARHRFDFARKKFNYFYYKTSSAYRDGASFISFYNDTYGHNKAKKALRSYMTPNSFFIFNFIVSSPISHYAKVAGLNNNDLYISYKNFLDNKYKIPAKNYTEGQLLFKNDYTNEYQVKKIIAIENNNIYYLGNKQTTPLSSNINTGIYSYNLTNGKPSTFLTINKSVLNASKSNNKLYYNATDYKNTNGTTFSSSYYYNNNKLIPYTTKLKEQRAINTIVSKEGLFHVLRIRDKQELVFIKNDSQKQKTIVPIENNFSFGSFSYDMMSNNLFFNASNPQDNQSYIYQYNLNTKSLRKLITGYEPFFINNQLFFSYNLPQERYNIYKLDLLTNKVYKITDTKFGAFDPYYYNNTLYYKSFYQDSNSIYRLQQSNFLNQEVTTKIPVLNTNVSLDATVSTSKETSSSTIITSNYKAKKLGWFDYKPEAFMKISNNDNAVINNIGITLVSLDASNTLSLSLSSVNYNDFYRDAPNKSILSPAFIFAYHPNQIDSGLDLFNFTSFYNKQYGGFIANINPIIFNGYGNLPIVYLNGKINHRADYLAGATLYFEKPKLKLSAGYETTYKNTSNVNFYNLDFNNNIQISYYIGYKNLDYSIKLRDTLDNITWHAKHTDYVLKATLQRELVFDDIYFGRKDGLLGINSITITPFATYFLSTNQKEQKPNTPNNYQSIYIGLDNYLTTRIFSQNIDIGLNLMHRINFKSYNPQQYNDIATGFDKKEDTSINLIFKFAL